MNLQEPQPKPRFDWQLAGMIALPILSVAVVTGAVVFALGDQMHPAWALFIGVILGIVVTGASIAEQGRSSIEIMVASAIIIVLTVILVPVLHRARQNGERRRARAAVRLQSKPAPAPAKP